MLYEGSLCSGVVSLPSESWEAPVLFSRDLHFEKVTLAASWELIGMAGMEAGRPEKRLLQQPGKRWWRPATDSFAKQMR